MSESSWINVESAPKDGSTVLGYFPDQAECGKSCAVLPTQWMDWDMGRGVWLNATNGFMMPHPPSYWMPLPPPPGAGPAAP